MALELVLGGETGRTGRVRLTNNGLDFDLVDVVFFCSFLIALE